MPSQAFSKLQKRLKDIQDLLDAGEKKGGKGVGRKWNVVALWRSAIVLCCAHLEGFVEDLFVESVNRITRANLGTAKVPDELKLIPLRRLADRIKHSEDRQKRDEALRGLLKEAAKLSHPAKIIRSADIPRKDIMQVTGSFMNPWPNEIDNLFANLGTPRILDGISWQGAGNRSIRARISELVNRRNKIVHGTLGHKVYKTQVTSYRKFLETFARNLDQQVRTYVGGKIGRAWR